ncbi:MAG TPA: hypothetical protein VFO60_08820, partial [Candidatus Dormibacteraeota bacterium]|nr:hypothetical protein [Candidatus Dormibacteraeota bacterium]
EVNLRFSGTAPMRAHLGFNDVEATVRHLVLGEPARDLPLVVAGRAARYWNEVYLDAGMVRTLEEGGTVAQPCRGAALDDMWCRA